MINTLEDLEKCLRLLNSHGVTSFKFSGLEINLDHAIESASQLTPPELPLPNQAELDAAVGMPVGGIDDPFLTYSSAEEAVDEDQAI